MVFRKTEFCFNPKPGTAFQIDEPILLRTVVASNKIVCCGITMEILNHRLSDVDKIRTYNFRRTMNIGLTCGYESFTEIVIWLKASLVVQLAAGTRLVVLILFLFPYYFAPAPVFSFSALLFIPHLQISPGLVEKVC